MHEHLVQSVTPLKGGKLFVVFQDASERIYDTKPLFEELPVFQRLAEDSELFFAVRPEGNGNAVIWDDNLDLASDELYINGQRI